MGDLISEAAQMPAAALLNRDTSLQLRRRLKQFTSTSPISLWDSSS
jgi:hypothetical protein